MLSFLQKKGLSKLCIGASNATKHRVNLVRYTSGTNNDSFLNGSNAVYVEQMYDSWRQDPASVHVSWASYFQNVKGNNPMAGFVAPPVAGFGDGKLPSAKVIPMAGSGKVSDSLGLSHLIRAYQVNGHLMASVDPLQMETIEQVRELTIEHHGFSEADMDRTLNLLGKSSGGNTGYLDMLTGNLENMTLRQLVALLQRTYCSTIGVEYMHIGSHEQRNWVRSQVETSEWMKMSNKKKMHIYERLCFADRFEKFLGHKFNTDKRFGLDGGESCIPGLKAMIDRGSELGVESFAFGMPHRGRLNVLANVMRKPMPQIFKEFQGSHFDFEEVMGEDWSASGDVKYHLGTSMNRTYPDGRAVHIALVANPSHLEAVNPVVCGKIRAKQYLEGDSDEIKKKHMPVLLHGDAAFAGQGVVYETMQMSRVEDYAVGGTVHVIVNNQVGFTTNPENARSTMYCSDLGKAFNIPIFHCNGDDPIAVVEAFEMATEWRQKFASDCIIDMKCYRRFGHNELDQPFYTQPLLYSKIAKHPDTLTVYEAKLLAEGVCTKSDIDSIKAVVNETIDNDFVASKTWETPEDDWLGMKWKGFLSPRQMSRIKPTGVPVDILRSIGVRASTLPADAHPHKQIATIFKKRLAAIEVGKGLDWGTAEALAFGSLLLEGNHVRLSGQDVQRGTFSHRHAVVRNQKDESGYCPLNHLTNVSKSIPLMKSLSDDPESITSIDDTVQAGFTVQNSILSEFGVLGFEMGYSLENPNMLCLWEAQFGDFVNGAQIMIDQFISAGEDKWLRQSAITMLLPHGYMGQGAEHSSCRLERFLQQTDEDPDVIPEMDKDERTQIQQHNWQVVNCSTPANYFHVLRRQIHRDFRKPLVVAAPKSLLRANNCTSTLEDMGPNTRFKRLIEEVDPAVANNSSSIRRLIYCTGKIYYELAEERAKRGITDIAIVRVEQLAPFPWDHVMKEAEHYGNAELYWVQEEPKNMGAWSFVEPRIATSTAGTRRATYVGRAPAAATSTGLGHKVHNAQQAAIINDALKA